MKILLAEDTADLNRAVSAALKMQGYEVDSALDGLQALDFLQRESYDCILLDIMMPGLDGISVLKELRSRRITTPVMLLTAKAEVDDRVAGLDAGADDYLPKPFAIKELLARVRSMIRRHDTYEDTTLHFLDTSLDPEGLTLCARNSVRLSIKEYELMKTLLSNTDVPLTTSYILDHVWRHEPGADRETVWLYISYLKGKLFSVGSGLSITGEKGGSFQLVPIALPGENESEDEP